MSLPVQVWSVQSPASGNQDARQLLDGDALDGTGASLLRATARNTVSMLSESHVNRQCD
jgi:hypothetical protein